MSSPNLRFAAKALAFIFVLITVALTEAASGAVLTYGYDSAGRLKQVNYGGFVSTSYQYDANGNLLARVNLTAPLPLQTANYVGLISNGTPTLSNEGILSLKVAANGAFTGKLTVGGKTFSFRGVFAADGTTAPIVISRKAPLPPFTLTLALDVSSGNQQLIGNLTDGTFTDSFTLDRTLFSKSDPVPSSLVGKYTALLRATSADVSIPQGTGYATIAIGSSGSVRAVGVLADSTHFAQGTNLTGAGTWSLFVQLYKKLCLLAGDMTFAHVPGVGDFAGTVDWIKPAAKKGRFAAGFSTAVALEGSRYTPPAKGERVLDLPDSSPNSSFATSGIDQALTLDVTNKISVAAPNSAKLKLTLKTKTGAISGSLLLDGKTRKLTGLLQLDQNTGEGFILTDTQSLPFALGE